MRRLIGFSIRDMWYKLGKTVCAHIHLMRMDYECKVYTNSLS